MIFINTYYILKFMNTYILYLLFKLIVLMPNKHKKHIEHYGLIPEKTLRRATYCKRKRGLIKKAMELSMLCGQHIQMTIYDPEKDKLVIFKSQNDFTSLRALNIEQ